MEPERVLNNCKDRIRWLKTAWPGTVICISQYEMILMGGITPALREELDFSHAWIHDASAHNVIIGRMADDNWKETMHLIGAKARADWDREGKQSPDITRAGAFRNELLQTLAKATPEEILRIKDLLIPAGRGYLDQLIEKGKIRREKAAALYQISKSPDIQSILAEGIKEACIPTSAMAEFLTEKQAQAEEKKPQVDFLALNKIMSGG